MSKQDEHSRLIAAAAKAALAPLGCKRVGRSRFWYSDERFWTISIEFQPSGWAKGSYLNVGANWLWYPKSDWGFSFSEDPRVEDFVQFENVAQFTPLITAMASRAALEVIRLRDKYKSLSEIYRHLVTRARRNGLHAYHAAVAAGLVGDTTTSRELFHRLENWQTYGDEDWQHEIKRNGSRLARLVDDPNRFRSTVLSIVADVRSRLCLPAEPQLIRTMDSIAAG